jgi:hypothetical protein
MHAPKHIQGALLGAALAASLAIAPAAQATADPPAQVGYVASFSTEADCKTGGSVGIQKGYWTAFHCIEEGQYWHLLVDLEGATIDTSA